MSSNEGSGIQYVVQWYSNGWEATGNLKSTHGNPVYYSGLVVHNLWPDETCGRYSTNTTSLTAVTRGGSCTHFPTGSAADGARFRVCRDLTGLPDTCGTWSSTEWKVWTPNDSP